MSFVVDIQHLPCGCLMGRMEDMDSVEDAIFVKPCSLLCEFYLFIVAETKAQGKPLTTHVT